MTTKLLLFLLLINFLPPLAAILWRKRYRRPLDLGMVCADGQPLFGPHKTVRGALLCIGGGALLGPLLLGLDWRAGGLGGLLVVSGDLLSSYIKRRLRYPSGKPVFLLDQIFEGLFPLLYLVPVLDLPLPALPAVLLLFIIIAGLGSRLWSYMRYRPLAKNLPRIVRSTVRLREWRACHQPLARWQRLLNFENYIYFRLLIGSLFKLLNLYDRGARNCHDIRIQEQEYRFADLPGPFDSFRIMLLTDLHLDGTKDLNELLIDKIKGLEVDLCLIGGDIRPEMFGSSGPSLRRLRALLGHVHSRHGILGVLGNHDCIEMVPDLEEAGILMLVNDSAAIERQGEKIWIIGIDDPHYYKVHDLGLAFKKVPGDGFKIFLAHSPEAYAEAIKFSPRLYLCGHTHGGQICLPNGKPIFTHSRAPRFTAAGPWVYLEMSGYTSRGVGTSGIPLRFNCPGEISLITLKRQVRGKR
ncbi:MAG: CDP-archaeol synthase [Desulfobacterales bacterium]|nr:CDP-archaeol synthase [Desulfobacterales bacterium]